MKCHNSLQLAIATAVVALLVPACASDNPTITSSARGNPGKGGGGGGGRPPTDESFGNNLSIPAIFAEGIGLIGVAAPTTPTGLLPYQETWTGLRIPASGNPTLPAQGTEGTYCDPTPPVAGTCPDGTLYYLQGIEQASWQASYQNGAGHASYGANVKWGDNLFGSPWTTTSTIHLEVSMKGTPALTDTDAQTYFPTKSLYGSGSTETFGSTAVETDVVTALNLAPAIYSEVAYLTIQAIDGPGGTAVGTPIHVLATWNRAVEGRSTAALTPEVNASGTIVYSYNWFTGRDHLAAGWYRLTFGVMTTAGGTLPGIANPAPVAGNANLQGVFTPASEEGGLPTLNPCGIPVSFMSGPEPQALTNVVSCSLDGTTSTLDLQLTSGGTGGGGGNGGGGGGGGGGGSGGGGGGGGGGGSGSH